MVLVTHLIWDDWNREHIARHAVTLDEVEEVCHRQHRVVESYRNRIVIIGKTNDERKLVIVLSPEDRDLRPYEVGIYYVITAFEEEETS